MTPGEAYDRYTRRHLTAPAREHDPLAYPEPGPAEPDRKGDE